MPGRDTIQVGSASVTRVLEWVGPFGPRREMVPDATDAQYSEVQPDLPVPFWDEAGVWRCAMQSWLVRTPSRTVLVDTCLGHLGQRPFFARLGYRSDAFMPNLAAAGIEPAAIDAVVITHTHSDHIGWNTRQVNGEWVPTFPNAEYLIHQADIDYIDPQASPLRLGDEAERSRLAGLAATYTECIEPLIRSNVATSWIGEHHIDEELELISTPGHTPGSASLRLRSKDESALFIGDALHLPVQIVAPDLVSGTGADEAQSAASRRQLLGEAADTRALLVPAHFVGPGALYVRRAGDAFAIDSWAHLQNV